MIPPVSRDDLLTALKVFDDTSRDSEPWENWESRKDHRYAIQYDGLLYPVKQIVSLATGAGTDTFSGGHEANSFVEERGFSVKELHEKADASSGRASYLLAWNPHHFAWRELPNRIRELRAVGSVREPWSCTSRSRISRGDRVFLIRLGESPRGIVGSGKVSGAPYEAPHWNLEKAEEKESSWYVDIDFDALIDVDAQEPLAMETLEKSPLNDQHWSTQQSGIRIKPHVAQELEKAWAVHLEELSRQSAIAPASKLAKRHDPDHVRTVFANLVPDRALRRCYEETFAAAVRRAHEVNPGSWTLKLSSRGGHILMNAGMALVLRVTRHRAGMIVTNETAQALFDKYGDPGSKQDGPSVFERPQGISYVHIQREALAEIMEEFGDVFRDSIKIAASSARLSPFRRAHSPGIRIYLEEALQTQLPRPEFPEPEPFRDEGIEIEGILRLVRRRYEEWDGFEHPQFKADEVDYKQATVKKAQQQLGARELDRLIREEDWDEIWNRIGQLGRDNNLLFNSVPRTGDLALLYCDGLNRVELASEFRELIHGEAPSPERLDRFSRWARDRGLPNKWTFPTYFLFCLHPDSEILVKPRITKQILRMIGSDLELSAEPSGDSYQALLGLLGDLSEELEPRDMIDLQSLLWVASRERQKEVLHPELRRQFQTLYQEFAASYPTTPAGQQHLGLYRLAREEGPRNYQEILADRNSGNDLTDSILLKLLPHHDTSGNRDRGAWIGWAPAITKDIKSWFEGSGWTKSEDWPQVAMLILQFVDSCVESTENLEPACDEFQANSLTKGMQMGMMTPILACVKPDDYVVINSKVRRVYNHFAGTDFDNQLSTYPDLNSAMFDLCEEVKAIMEAYPIGAPRPTDALDMFSHWLVAEKKHPLGKTQYYKLAPGPRGEEWADWEENNYAAIGWSDMGDLSSASLADFRRRRDELVDKFDDWTKTGVNQVWRFLQLHEGDIIIANRGTQEVLGIGEVTGPYFFVPDAPLAHRVPVEWNDTKLRKVDKGGWRRTLIKLDRDEALQILGTPTISVVYPAPGVGGTGAATIREVVPPPVTPRYSLEECSRDTGVDLPTLERWRRAIDRKGQAIFYGPPGTGKTYLARHLAKHFIGGGEGFYELVQFHPSYAYEDFIQGIRPQTTGDGQLSYELVQGSFHRFCQKAEEKGDDICVLIVDEINRANLSRVFGELMYLLEYRDEAVRLAGGGKFNIPANVRIIGTMNTADRSIALVDHALRRRFAFLELRPDYALLRKKVGADERDLADRLVILLEEINERIQDPNFYIGITFFLDPNLREALQDIWIMEIEPYLQEYFFNAPDVVDEYRWSRISDRLIGAEGRA